MPGRVGFAGSVAPPYQRDRSSDSARVCGRALGPLQDLKLLGPIACIAQQRVRIIDLILPQDLQRCLQVLPQQVDFGWCQHPGFFRGSEPLTG